jgi:hypothetical protein
MALCLIIRKKTIFLFTFKYPGIYLLQIFVAPLGNKYIERFIMFSVITNIYDKKTKGPTLMELFTATGKLKKKVFLTTKDVRCVRHGGHGTHRYDIKVLATHASTWMHRYSSQLQ